MIYEDLISVEMLAEGIEDFNKTFVLNGKYKPSEGAQIVLVLAGMVGVGCCANKAEFLAICGEAYDGAKALRKKHEADPQLMAEVRATVDAIHGDKDGRGQA